MSQPIPFLLERHLVPKIWGGRGFERTPGFALPKGETFGESWELYDRPEGSSRIRGTDRTLDDVLRASPELVLGRGVAPGYGDRFPLLLKFVDAHEALSVQVHPDDEQAKPENDGGKDEAWLVVHAGPRARVIRGVRPGVDRQRFAAAASTSAVESLLCSFTPRPGDTIHLPPGIVHSVGPDAVIFEVQKNSDVTYRIWDWGRDREVHVQKALGVMRLDAGGATVAERPVVASQPTADGGKLLIATPNFRMRRYDLQRPFTLPTAGRYCTVTVLAGRGVLGWRSGGNDAPLQLLAGDTALIPACVESAFLSPIGRLDLVACDPGERR